MTAPMPDPTVTTASHADRRPSAPGRLELVRQFLNTLDIEAEADDFATPVALAAWLTERGLLPRGQRLSERDLAAAVELREVLRDVLEGNAGHVVDDEARQHLDRIADTVPLRLRLADGPRLDSNVRNGVALAIGQLLAVIYEAMLIGTWERLKVCHNDTCRWAFYDSSRNRSGAWCSMAICGNRIKGRSFRRRHGGPMTATA